MEISPQMMMMLLNLGMPVAMSAINKLTAPKQPQPQLQTKEELYSRLQPTKGGPTYGM